MQFQDYYATLGVTRGASESEIKSAYRRLAKQHHPDVNKGDPGSAERFKQISEAYAVLGDAEKRRRYDQLGPDWERATQGGGGGRASGASGTHASGFSDFFDLFFGGAGGSMFGGMGDVFGDVSAAAPTSAPAEATVEVSLQDVLHGAQRRLSVRSAPCATCRGRGTVTQHASQGRRRVAMSHTVCPTCGGRGVSGEPRTLDVRIPAGIENGAVLRVRPGGQEIHLTVRYVLPPGIEVRGRDVVVDVPVLDHEVALGARIDVPTLTGSVRLTVPEGASIGSLLRVRGQGLPGRAGAAAGDLLVRLQWATRPALSGAERAAYEALRAAREGRGDDPRQGLAHKLHSA